MAKANVDAVDAIVRAEMLRSQTPGVAILVRQNGKVIKRQGYGIASLKTGEAVGPDTLFESGSLGKQFTATLIMTLVGDGSLSLDNSIIKFFPEGSGRWNGITVRHLLNHTSGLSDMPYDQMDLRQEYTDDDLVRIMASQPTIDLPGSNWDYNNGGYVLLGILVERLTGRFYGDLLKERVFDPLGMKTAHVIGTVTPLPNAATGYEIDKGKIAEQEWVSPSLNQTADGSLHLSLNDLEKWDTALSNEKVLEPRLITQMWEPTILGDGSPAIVNPGSPIPVNYGFGWTIRKQVGCTCIAHGGGWQGFETYYARIPEKKLSVVVLANCDMADAQTIGKSILELYAPALRDGRVRADKRIP